jgi:hypothetical protein
MPRRPQDTSEVADTGPKLSKGLTVFGIRHADASNFAHMGQSLAEQPCVCRDPPLRSLLSATDRKFPHHLQQT